ncbi:BspA family leucine-rich repeat surface protein, partial [Lacticaseibacillus jixianensis]|uniref:BspA family leucine-rich repeat surface protein n=1 Tax=Lacticaseibacillus jixianensis TaxID=2486012 RepID=UPI000F7688A8
MSQSERRKSRVAASLGLTVLMSSVVLGGMGPVLTHAATNTGRKDPETSEVASQFTVPDSPSDAVSQLPTGQQAAAATVEEGEEAKPVEGQPAEEAGAEGDTASGENTTPGETPAPDTAPESTPGEGTETSPEGPPIVPEAETSEAPEPAEGAAAAAEDEAEVAEVKADEEGTWGTVPWRLEDGVLTLESGEGADTGRVSPWINISNQIEKVVVAGHVVAPRDASWLFDRLGNVKAYEGLENLDLSTTEDMSDFFYGNFSLEEIDVSSWDVSSCLNFDGLFSYSSLKTLDLSSWATNPEASWFNSFASMNQLGTVNLSGIHSNSSQASFAGTYSELEELVLGDETKLKEFPTPGGAKWLGDSTSFSFVDEYPGGHADTYRLVVTNQGTWGTVAWRLEDGILHLDEGEGKNTNYQSPWGVIADQVERVVVDGDIVMPTNASNLFANFTAVTAYEGLEKMDMSQAGSLDHLFYNNQSLQNLDVASWNVTNCDSFYSMFARAGIQNLDLSSWQPKQDANFQSAFEYMIQLGSVNLSSLSMTSPQSVLWGGYDRLEELVLGDQTLLKDVPTPDYKEWRGVNSSHSFKDEYEGGHGDTYHLVWSTEAETGTWGTVPWRFEEGVLYLEGGEGAETDLWSPWRHFSDAVSKVVVEGKINAPQDISYLFEDFTSATSYEGLENIDTSRVENMSGVFYNNSKLSSVDLADWDVSHVKSMGQMFDGSGLVSLDLSQWAPNPKVDVTLAFGSMSNLRELNLSSFNLDDSADFGDGTDQLEVLILGDRTLLCGIPNVSGKNWVGEKTGHSFFQTYGGGHADTYRLQDATMEGEWGSVNWQLEDGILSLNEGVGTDTHGESPWASIRELIDEVVINGKVAAPVDSSRLFYDLRSVISYVGLEHLDVGAVQSMNSMFGYNVNVQSLDVSNWDTSNVKTMYGTFEDCHRLEQLPIEAWDVSTVDDICYFLYGTNLSTLDLSGWQYAGRYSNWAFEDMENLRELDISNFDTPTNASMFYGNSSLEVLTLGANSKARGLDREDGKVWQGEKTGHQFSHSYGGGYPDTYRLVEDKVHYLKVDLIDEDLDRNVSYDLVYGQVGDEISVKELSLPSGYELVDKDQILTILENDSPNSWEMPATTVAIRQVPKTTTRTIILVGHPDGDREVKQTIKWNWDWKAESLENLRLVYLPQSGYEAYQVPVMEGYKANFEVVEAKSFDGEYTELPEDELFVVTYEAESPVDPDPDDSSEPETTEPPVDPNPGESGEPEPPVDPNPGESGEPEQPVDPNPGESGEPEPPVDPNPGESGEPEPPVDPNPGESGEPEPPVDPNPGESGEPEPPVDPNPGESGEPEPPVDPNPGESGEPEPPVDPNPGESGE